MNQQLINMAFTSKQRNKVMTFNDAVKLLWNKNLISTGELSEVAIAATNKKLKQNPRGTKGSDFNDGSEVKYKTVTYSDSKFCGRAGFAGLTHKTGKFRAVVFEPKTQKNYFFIIPYCVYSKVVSPKVYFDINGKPRKTTRSDSNFDMWKYKVTAEQWAAK